MSENHYSIPSFLAEFVNYSPKHVCKTGHSWTGSMILKNNFSDKCKGNFAAKIKIGPDKEEVREESGPKVTIQGGDSLHLKYYVSL